MPKNIPKKPNSSKEIYETELKAEEGKMSCEICQKVFKSKVSLHLHLKHVHSEKQKFKCKICKRSFKKKWILKGHQRIHLKRQIFNCVECGKLFRYKKDLIHHEILIHAKEPIFFCNLCSKFFVSKYHLKAHEIYAHSKMRKFRNCKKVFERKRFLRNLEKNLSENIHNGVKIKTEESEFEITNQGENDIFVTTKKNHVDEIFENLLKLCSTVTDVDLDSIDVNLH